MNSTAPKIIGVNKRFYPAHIFCPGLNNHGEFIGENGQSMNPPPTVCVLVLGDIEDYAAYVGHGDPGWVASYGDKISFQEAQCHFPGIVREKYRD